MIDKINNNQVQNLINSGNQPSPAKNVPNNDVDASLQVNYVPVMQNNDDDTEAVEHARNLLLSGELESPENIKDAAENIIEFGI